MPEIGRFFNIDLLTEKYYYNSPYAFSENKVIAYRELEGLEAVTAKQVLNNEIKKVEGAWNGLVSNAEAFFNTVIEKITPTENKERSHLKQT